MAEREIIYTLRLSTRFAAKTRRTYAVQEIIVDGEVVGALHSGDGYLFAEVQWPDGTRAALGDCTPNYSSAPDFMVCNVMARRTLPVDEAQWRVKAHAIRQGWTARRASDGD